MRLELNSRKDPSSISYYLGFATLAFDNFLVKSRQTIKQEEFDSDKKVFTSFATYCFPLTVPELYWLKIVYNK